MCVRACASACVRMCLTDCCNGSLGCKNSDRKGTTGGLACGISAESKVLVIGLGGVCAMYWCRICEQLGLEARGNYKEMNILRVKSVLHWENRKAIPELSTWKIWSLEAKATFQDGGIT